MLIKNINSYICCPKCLWLISCFHWISLLAIFCLWLQIHSMNHSCWGANTEFYFCCQQLRAYVALVDDLSSFLNIQVKWFTSTWNSSSGDLLPLLYSIGSTHIFINQHRDIQTKHPSSKITNSSPFQILPKIHKAINTFKFILWNSHHSESDTLLRKNYSDPYAS